MFSQEASPALSQTFFFRTKEEAIYKITNPFSEFKTVYVTSKNSSYVPYFDTIENSYYIYGDKSNTYQISQVAVTPYLKFPKIGEINNKLIYNYYCTPNWFHNIINADEIYKETFYLGTFLDNRTSDSLAISLYDFTNGITNFDVKINDLDTSLSFNGVGEHKIKLKYPITDGNVSVEIFSPLNSLGLINYTYKSTGRTIECHNTFQKYIAEKDSKFRRPTNPDFYLFSFIEGKLEKIDFQNIFYKYHPYKNLLVQKVEKIAKLEIQQTQELNLDSCDYMVVTSKDLLPQTCKLVELLKKRTPKYKFNIVDVQGIFDMFSKSEKSPDAIKQYLHLTNPKYVLFVGDANVQEDAYNNIIPTFYYYQATRNSRIATDYKYTYINNCGMPQFALGRIPVSSANELENYINKLKIYFNLRKTRNNKLIYDDEKTIDIAQLDTSYSISTKKDKGFIYNLLFDSFIEDIKFYKPRIIIHLGHGSHTCWRKINKITVNDFEGLKSKNLFNLIDLSCWTGEFAHRTEDGFAENLLKLEDRGAVNVLCYSGFSYLQSHPYIVYYISKRIKTYDIGTIIKNLKIELFNQGILSMDDLHSFNLLGIPSLYLLDDADKFHL